VTIASALNDLSYMTLCTIGQTVVRAFYAYRDHGPPPPTEGGLLVVANHLCYLDPVFVQMALRRRVRFLMTEDFYDFRGLRWFFRWMRALRVRERGSNLDSLREARDELRAGAAVAIFPEGRLSRDGELGRAHPGAAALASLARVPVLPIRLRGTYDVFRKGWRVPRLAAVRAERRPLITPVAGRLGRKELTRRMMESLGAP
jgi:1-acyl-sn-glycerol-3-phosphate acyltransferase